MKGKVTTPGYIFEFSQQMRRDMTHCEKLLWRKIQKRRCGGYKFRSQHPIGNYILDFYCHEKKLAVEVDGSSHDDKSEYDMHRDNWLLSIGIKTLRFRNSEVSSKIEDVLSVILYELQNR